jgi:hypothetical protein
VAQEERLSGSERGAHAQPSGGGPDEPKVEPGRAARWFDIRRFIGGVFALYGLVLTVLGIVGSHTVKHKAAGINIDLWTGLGMLVFAGLMIFWALARPEMAEPAS